MTLGSPKILEIPALLEIDNCLALLVAPLRLLAVKGRLFRLKYFVKNHIAVPPTATLNNKTFWDKFNCLKVVTAIGGKDCTA